MQARHHVHAQQWKERQCYVMTGNPQPSAWPEGCGKRFWFSGGPCYQWTRKEKGKTVSLALSKEQYEAMREAIEGWREVEAILDRMQQLTRLRIFGSLPDVRRRKPLTKKVLGVK